MLLVKFRCRTVTAPSGGSIGAGPYLRPEVPIRGRERVGDSSGSTRQSEFGQDPTDVVLDGFRADEQPLADLGIVETATDQLEHLGLPPGELSPRPHPTPGRHTQGAQHTGRSIGVSVRPQTVEHIEGSIRVAMAAVGVVDASAFANSSWVRAASRPQKTPSTTDRSFTSPAQITASASSRRAMPSLT